MFTVQPMKSTASFIMLMLLLQTRHLLVLLWCGYLSIIILFCQTGFVSPVKNCIFERKGALKSDMQKSIC